MKTEDRCARPQQRDAGRLRPPVAQVKAERAGESASECSWETRIHNCELCLKIDPAEVARLRPRRASQSAAARGLGGRDTGLGTRSSKGCGRSLVPVV